jgi:hypothetical protein
VDCRQDRPNLHEKRSILFSMSHFFHKRYLTSENFRDYTFSDLRDTEGTSPTSENFRDHTFGHFDQDCAPGNVFSWSKKSQICEVRRSGKERDI